MYRNLTDALIGSLRLLLAEGATVPSRNGETKELYCHQVRIEKPTERVLVTPHRGANIFAQLAETMWVLGGRNDVEYLSRYLPRAKDYSDDGKTWRGAYGPRIRGWRGEVKDRVNANGMTSAPEIVDQIAECVKILKNDLSSRRAVAVIFDPAADFVESKDIPCLAGETLLWSPEGDLPIEVVSTKFESGEVTRWPVYAVNPTTQEMKVQWADKVWKSGEKQTIKLNFDDGSSLRLTKDHRIYLKKRVKSPERGPKATTLQLVECEAGDLRPGDRILATSRRYTPKGYETHKKVLNGNTAWDNLQPTHREYMELMNGPIPEGMDVHHKNEDKTDNRAMNMEILEHGHHSSLNMFGNDNPMNRMGSVKMRARAGKQAHSLRENHTRRSPEQKALTSEKQRQAALRRYANKENHKVVSVEDGGFTSVYDFRVPGFHTAVVGTGVVAHNCNNWLHFIVRDGKLNLTVGVRSNDVVWGFSGINVFEWSVLQQMMAHWIGIGVGVMAYTASSFHLYDYHYEKAEKMVSAARSKTLYDFGIPQIPFKTSFEDFDNLLAELFYVEKNPEVGHGFVLEDPFLQAVSQMLYIYICFQKGSNVHDIADLVNRLPPSDIRVGAIMWLRQQKGYKENGFEELLRLSSEERAFLSWYTKPASEFLTAEEVHETLKVLHYKKTLSYGDSWRKQGEVLGVFANISRKRDRILALHNGARGTSDEGMMDTVADLCVYASKYLTLLAELYPVAFTDFLGTKIGGQTFVVDADLYCGVEGFDRCLDFLSSWVPAESLGSTIGTAGLHKTSLQENLEFVDAAYLEIAEVLTAPTRTENGRIVIPAAAALGFYCVNVIQALFMENPRMWRNYVDTVEKL